MLRTSWLSSIPSTTMRPSWKSSKRFMHRISVDLPEPEGPITTTTSPRATSRLMPRSTWSLPKYLCRFSIWMMGSIFPPVYRVPSPMARSSWREA